MMHAVTPNPNPNPIPNPNPNPNPNQALAPAAGERSSWPEPKAAATDAGCSSDVAMTAAQAEHMPVCIGEKSWADRDAEARRSVIDVEAESAAPAPVPECGSALGNEDESVGAEPGPLKVQRTA